MIQKKIPMRKCVGCGISRPQKELVRLVLSEGHVSVDRTGRAHGRGVYLCPEHECTEKAKKRGALRRAFGIDIDKEELEKLMKEVEECGDT